MLLYILYSAAMGWCGTHYPGWWKGPHPHPDPDPNPWWMVIGAGLVFGVIGGAIIMKGFGYNDFIHVGVASYAAGRIGTDLLAVAKGMMKK